jgi:hypothetical protein
MLLEGMKYIHKGRKMVNYSNGKVYKLVSFDTDAVYYGSTCSNLSKRLAGHKAHYKRWSNGSCSYITSFEVVQCDGVEIILVEKVNCTSKEELHAAERKHVEANTCVNKNIPGRTREQYRQNKKELISVSGKKYYQENKKAILEYHDIYRAENRESLKMKQKKQLLCECGYNYTYAHTARHKRSKKHLKYLLSIAESDTEYSSESSEYEFDGVPHKKIPGL